MPNADKFAAVAAILAGLAVSGLAPSLADPKAKNWTAPPVKIYAQALSDQIMGAHPELISVTFHGVPPGLSNVYTMFAGSFPERIGNPDDPDDIDVSTKGITIVDPRWHRNDSVKKFVILLPLRDTKSENVGLIVFAFKNDEAHAKDERAFTLAAMDLRDSIQSKISSYAALFEPAK